jgi:transcriptional regulator with XRE-family HTH domain
MARLPIAIFEGGLLAFVRKKKGITNRQMEIACGLSHNDRYKIENGYTNMGRERLMLILSQLNITLDEYYLNAPLYIVWRDQAHIAEGEQKPQSPTKPPKSTKRTKPTKPRKR